MFTVAAMCAILVVPPVFWQDSGRFKQCSGRANRSECGCTDMMKLSDEASVSDCKERVGMTGISTCLLGVIYIVHPYSGTTETRPP